MANPAYTDHLADIITWIQDTSASMTATGNSQPDPTARDWCLLKLTSVDPAVITSYFDNTDINAQYLAEYKQVTGTHILTNNPVAYMQYESDCLYGLQKSFIFRHTSRMASYRDDCEQKDIRLHNLLQYTSAKFNHLKKTA